MQASSYSQASSSQAEEKTKRFPAHKFSSLSLFNSFVKSRLFMIGDQRYTVSVIPVHERKLLATPAPECTHPYKDIANCRISLEEINEPRLLPFFKALQLAKKCGFFNGHAKTVWTLLYSSFIPQVGFSNVPTHRSDVGALKALVGIEHILSGGEPSSTSAIGTTMDTILMTGMPDFIILDKSAEDVRVACENKSPSSQFGQGQGMHYLLTAMLMNIVEGRSPTRKVGFFVIDGKVTAAEVGVPLNNEIIIRYEAQPMDFFEAIPYVVELIKKTVA